MPVPEHWYFGALRGTPRGEMEHAIIPAPAVTRDLRAMAVGAGAGDPDELVRRGLEWLSRVAPYDLATVFDLVGERLVVRAARGPLADQRVREMSLDLARFPSIREAIASRRARAFTEHDHREGDGDPFDGVLDLPAGHACMVVPLFTSEGPLGLLTLDRSRCEVFPPAVVDLVEVYAQVLALALENAAQREALGRLHAQQREHARLLDEEVHGDDDGVLTRSGSPRVRLLAERARQVARTDTPVLVLGETGTGKEHLARAIHRWSARAERPFVKINCAAIPSTLLESELFGHLRGSFTGATRDRAGRFQTADGGTLLLDEIGELPLDLQAKLLRVLQEGTFEAVGSDRTTRVDVRVIAATHVDLARAVSEGRFRADLFYRLDVFPLTVPPLRDRLEDLAALCDVLLRELGRRTGRRGATVTPAGLEKLRGHRWPGNIRELGNVLERATILSPVPALAADALDLPMNRALPSPAAAAPDESPLRTLEEIEASHIRAVLRHTRGKVYGEGGAAEILGMKPSTLQSRMKKLGVARVGDAAD
jgi:transcriptional regulator with GAF, ATPase, and Fis domain